MAIAKAQLVRTPVICKCGCGETFTPFPVYRKRSEGGGLYTPQYKRGHNPICAKTQTGNKPAWNAGLKKSDHPSMKRMGFKRGHPAYCDWSHVNERLANDKQLKARWLAAKKGKKPWNLGHADWRTVKTGARKTAAWKNLRKKVLKRDDGTCQRCGLKPPSDKESQKILHCHHVIPACVRPDLFLSELNLITLCDPCHKKEHKNLSKKATP